MPSSSSPVASAWTWVELDRPADAAHRSDQISAADHGRELEEAYRRGFAEGADSAKAEARRELKKALEAANAVAEEISANRAAWAAHLKENLATLAAGIAARVIEAEVTQSSERFVQLTEKVIATFPVEESLRIRLHPADHAALSVDGDLDRVVGERSVRWVADSDVVRGGCIVEGPDRIVDGRVDEALKRVIRTLSDD